MALPGVNPIAGAAASIGAPIQTALVDVAKAIGKIGEAARAALPFLDTLGEQLKQLGERIKDTFRIYVGAPILDGLKAIGRGIQYALPTNVLDGIVKFGGKAAEAVGAVGKALQSMAVAAPVAGAAFMALGTAMGVVVQKANPAIFQQFQLALNDTLAVIGQGLAPVLQVVTEAVRMFGDTLGSFARDLGGPLAEIVRSLLPIFQIFLDVFARVGEVVGQVLQLVAPMIKFVADGIKSLFDWMGEKIRWLLDLLGVDIGESKVKPGSSVGAATRQASITGVSDVIRQAQVSAFSLGNASGVNWGEKTAGYTFSMGQTLGRLLDVVGNISSMVRNLNEIAKTKADIKKMEKDLAPGGYYDKQLQDTKAQRALAELALNTAGFTGVYKTPGARTGKDGSGTVQPG